MSRKTLERGCTIVDVQLMGGLAQIQFEDQNSYDVSELTKELVGEKLGQMFEGRVADILKAVNNANDVEQLVGSDIYRNPVIDGEDVVGENQVWGLGEELPTQP